MLCGRVLKADTYMLKVQPSRETVESREAPEQRQVAKRGGWPVRENPMLRKIMRLSGGILPYLAWLVPLVDRLVPRRDPVTAGLQAFGDDLRNELRSDMKQHLAAIQTVQASQVNLTPALEEQQRRLERLEEHAAELNHSLTNLSEDQLDLADQVRAMAGWVRNASIAALFLLVLLFVLKLVQAIHGMGH